MPLVWRQERSQMNRSQPRQVSTMAVGSRVRPDSTTTTMDGRPVKTATGSTFRYEFVTSWSCAQRRMHDSLPQTYILVKYIPRRFGEVCIFHLIVTKIQNPNPHTVITDSLQQKFSLPKLKTDSTPILTPYFSLCWHVAHNNSTADIFVSVCGGRDRVSEWERESEWEVLWYRGLAARCLGKALFPVFYHCANFVPSLSLSYDWARGEKEAQFSLPEPFAWCCTPNWKRPRLSYFSRFGCLLQSLVLQISLHSHTAKAKLASFGRPLRE